ncbi:MAG: DUF4445 domain-containing protein [Anaerolineales bacterium]|nr:DUF4445 domain-containing protein [Anaerolineales bacterium]
MTSTHKVTFDNAAPVEVPTGATLTEAAALAGIVLNQPCGGQGRCGRCVVKVQQGEIRRRSTLRLSEGDIGQGYALACQAVVEGDVSIHVPPQEKLERRLVTDLTASSVAIPDGYCYAEHQTVQRIPLRIDPPSMEDQTDDWSRLQRSLRQTAGIDKISISLPMLRKIGQILRDGDWEVTAIVEKSQSRETDSARLLDLFPIHFPKEKPLWGVAIDIGTTTVSVWLTNLITGQVLAQTAEYNQQIQHGEDVISRIIYDSKEHNEGVLQKLVIETINKLIERACQRAKAKPEEIYKAVVVGNSIMLHLLLNIPAATIRTSPFINVFNESQHILARELDLTLHPEAPVEVLPTVASYVGADITAGALSSGIADTEKTTLFLDVGTNGEMVLGNKDWMVTCACSAGPAFEGAGVVDGMRATKGAIEEVWINADTYEPNIRVIGGGKPRGLCGSGLIALLAELFLAGVVDKSGNINTTLNTPRVRTGAHEGEYVVAFAAETSHGKDIVITHVDIDNLLRAKAAIFAGYVVLAEGVGVPLNTLEQVLIGGSFGQYINVEKAIEIGLLPDLPWENFHFLGNTAVRGAYYALLNWQSKQRVNEIAGKMTYIELSADNAFYDAFMSALFLPHTDLSLFPTVVKLKEQNQQG